MRFSYYLGLDLGQAQDYTAISVIEEPVWIPDEETAFRLVAPRHGWVSPAELVPAQLAQARDVEYYAGRPERPVLALRHLERLPLGTPYPAVVQRVVHLMQTPPLAGRAPMLLVDHTGVGRPVSDLLRQHKLPLVAITITGGTAITQDGADLGVPKRDLISTMAVLLEGRRLQIAESLPEAAALTKELQVFQRRVSRAGNDQYAAWREGTHDDLVLATALACWYREWFCHHLDNGGGQITSSDYREWAKRTKELTR